jgi:hypothetical protein
VHVNSQPGLLVVSMCPWQDELCRVAEARRREVEDEGWSWRTYTDASMHGCGHVAHVHAHARAHVHAHVHVHLHAHKQTWMVTYNPRSLASRACAC